MALFTIPTVIFARSTLHAGALLATLGISNCASATLVLFDFDSDNGFQLTAEEQHPQIINTAINLTLGDLTDFAGNPGRALGATGFVNTNSITVQLSAAAGWRFSVDALQFDLRVSPSGPSDWQLNLNGATLGSGVTATRFVTHSLNRQPVGQGFQSSHMIELQASNAVSAQGTLRLDNLKVSGKINAVPLPATWVLLGTPALIAGLRVRRQRIATLVSNLA